MIYKKWFISWNNIKIIYLFKIYHNDIGKYNYIKLSNKK